MKRTFLCWHLGLGDAIICCGLVRGLVKGGHLMTLPHQPQYKASLVDLFFDLIDSDQVRLHSTDEGDPYTVPGDHDVIRIGNHGEGFDHTKWDESFYKQAGIAPWAMHEYFKVGASREGRSAFDHNNFIHDDAARGFNVPGRIHGWRPAGDMGRSIFDYLPDIMASKEFHGINSAFALMLAFCDYGFYSPRRILYDVRPEPLPRIAFGPEWEVVRP